MVGGKIFGMEPSPWLVVPIVYLVWVLLGLSIKRVVVRILRRGVTKTRFKWDDVLIHAADTPLTLLVFAAGGVVVERFLPSSVDGRLAQWMVLGFKAVTIVAVILFTDRFVSSMLRMYSGRVEILRTSGGIAQGFARILVIGIGFLILLDSFGISITPLIASLGIGSLAIALALQPTLENLFAGIQIIVDKPFLVGHFIKLESGEEGYVHRIGWRSTWVRLLPNNVVIIPNKILVNSRVLNYYYPETEMAVLVQVGVHYDADLEHVERVTIEVAKETLASVQGGVAEFEPFIRYHTFADFSINFTVILRGREFVDNYLIKHEFIKRLHKRYAREGIVIPYPIRAINYAQEKVSPVSG